MQERNQALIEKKTYAICSMLSSTPFWPTRVTKRLPLDDGDVSANLSEIFIAWAGTRRFQNGYHADMISPKKWQRKTHWFKVIDRRRTAVSIWRFSDQEMLLLSRLIAGKKTHHTNFPTKTVTLLESLIGVATVANMGAGWAHRFDGEFDGAVVVALCAFRYVAPYNHFWQPPINFFRKLAFWICILKRFQTTYNWTRPNWWWLPRPCADIPVEFCRRLDRLKYRPLTRESSVLI